MNKEEILKRAIGKAVKNGWDGGENDPKHLVDLITEKDETWGTIFDQTSVDSILFDHDFARAFWGERDWPYYLKILVLETDRLAYIHQFLTS